MREDVTRLISKLLEERGISMKRASEHLGRNPSYIQQFIERGHPAELRERDRERLATLLRISPDQLRNDDIGKSGGSDNIERPLQARQDLPSMGSLSADIPVQGVAVGGVDGEFHLQGQTVDYVRRPPGLIGATNPFAIYIFGSSMAPRYEEGDLIFIHPGRPPRIGDDVVVELYADDGETGGAAFLKRLVRRTAEKIICEQYNPACQVEYEIERVRNLWRVVRSAELFGF